MAKAGSWYLYEQALGINHIDKKFGAIKNIKCVT